MASSSSTQNISLSTNTAISYNDPYFLSSNDNSNAQLGQIVFNGNNYVNWSRSVQLALGAKNKTGFIDGTLCRPADDSPDLQKWIRNDYMVTCWILYSIDKSIAESFIFSPSARDLWLEIQERYGHSNAPQLYDFHKNLMSMVQNDDSIVEYYSKLKKIWDQLQILEPIPECTCGVLLKCSCGFMKKLIEADQLKKLIQFVAGLNKSYDQAKINILSMDPLPTVNRVYHMLQQIERQNSLAVSQSAEMSALLSIQNNQNQAPHNRVPLNWPNKRDYRDSKKDKLDRFCEYCKVKGHLKDQCFKLVGYPDWYKGKTSNAKTSASKFAGNVQETISHSALDCAPSGTSDDTNAALYKEFLKFMNLNHQPASFDSTSGINFADLMETGRRYTHLLDQRQLSSHAQKYFLKVQKNGTSEHVPPPRPKRKAAHPYPQKAPKNGGFQSSSAIPGSVATPNSLAVAVPTIHISISAMSSWNKNILPPVNAAGPNEVHNCSYSSDPRMWPTGETMNDRKVKQTIKVMPDFAQVYSFIGSVFDSNASGHVERLKMMDPIDIEMTLMLMKNLAVNLPSPEFEDHRRLISSYDPDTGNTESGSSFFDVHQNNQRADAILSV